MKFKSKLIAVIIALSALLASLSAPALAFIDASEEFYVNDRAEVLSSETEENIISKNLLLEEKTGAQIVVATVRYLEGYYCDEYAVTIFNDWGVGDADKNNGMLLLLATEEKKAWLTQGSGIKKDFSSDYIDKLMDKYFWDDFDNKEYDKAVTSLFDELIDWYEDEYNIKISSSSAKKVSKAAANGIQATVNTVKTVAGGLGKATVAVVVIVFVLIFSLIFGGRGRRRRTNYFTNTPRPGAFYTPHFNRRPPYSGRSTSSSSFRSGSSGFSGRSSSSRSFGGGRSSFGGGHSGGHSGGGGRSSGGGGGRR
jgi:uncharacterized protein